MNRIDRVTAQNAIRHLQKTPGKPNQTIRTFRDNSGLPECFLRKLLKQGLLPGTYSGNRFYVDVLRFEEYMETHSGAEAYGKQ